MTVLADGSSGLRAQVRAVFGGISLIFLIVLNARFGPLAAYIAMGALLLSLLVPAARPWRQAITEPAALAFLGAFALLGLAFSVTAQNAGDVYLTANFGALLLVLPAIMAMAPLLNGRQGALILFTLALLAVIVATWIGIDEVFVLHRPRATGSFSPIYFSDLGAFYGFLALGGVLFATRWWKWLYAAGPVLGLACAMLGGTRGSLLVVAALAVVFVVFALMAWPRRRVFAALGVMLGLAVGVAIVALVASPRTVLGFARVWRELTTGSGDHSTMLRVEFYTGGWRAFLDAPIFGHGWSRRFSAAMQYMDRKSVKSYSVDISHLHNDVLNMLSGAGLVGLASYLLSMAAPLLAAFRPGRPADLAVRYAAVSLVVGFVTMGLTDSVLVFELPKTSFYLLTGAIIAMCLPRVSAKPAAASNLSPSVA